MQDPVIDLPSLSDILKDGPGWLNEAITAEATGPHRRISRPYPRHLALARRRSAIQFAIHAAPSSDDRPSGKALLQS